MSAALDAYGTGSEYLQGINNCEACLKRRRKNHKRGGKDLQWCLDMVKPNAKNNNGCSKDCN